MTDDQRNLSALPLTEAQSDWFIREVKRCAAIGMPLGCCEEWPECSHVLDWTEKRGRPRLRVERRDDGLFYVLHRDDSIAFIRDRRSDAEALIATVERSES